MVRTRFAPSPTGDLHLGGAWTALASWTIAKRAGGASVLRVEDIDTPRVVSGCLPRILDDLGWLGLTWDEGPDIGGGAAPYVQSERHAIYGAALELLDAKGLTYACDCSRAEIAGRAARSGAPESEASAPHTADEIVYPGTCRELPRQRAFKRAPALRLRVPHACDIGVDDRVAGTIVQRIDRQVGDFVLQRGDGVFAYQLATAVDDRAMRITDVVRGADLLASTPRQVLLMRLLGGTDLEPRYWHVPLVVASDGERLAKRTKGKSVRELRRAGISAEEILGELAFALGLAATREPTSAREIAARAPERIVWRRDPWRIPARWAAAVG